MFSILIGEAGSAVGTVIVRKTLPRGTRQKNFKIWTQLVTQDENQDPSFHIYSYKIHY